MSYDCKDVISKELLPDEIVLWQGKPNIAKAFTKYDFFLVPFSLFWGGFSIVWCILAASAGTAFALFGIPFVLIGLYLIVGRFVYKKANKKKTYYAITNKRVLAVRIDSKGIKKGMVSAQINSIPSESVSLSKDGTGSIIFGTIPFVYTMYQNTGLDFFAGAFQDSVVSFFDIENCEAVLQIYRNEKY